MHIFIFIFCRLFLIFVVIFLVLSFTGHRLKLVCVVAMISQLRSESAAWAWNWLAKALLERARRRFIGLCLMRTSCPGNCITRICDFSAYAEEDRDTGGW